MTPVERGKSFPSIANTDVQGIHAKALAVARAMHISNAQEIIYIGTTPVEIEVAYLNIARTDAAIMLVKILAQDITVTTIIA